MIRALFLFLLAILAGLTSLSAKELADPGSGCSLTIPDDWQIQTFPANGSDYSVAARSPDKTEGVSLFVTPSKAQTINDADGYVKDFTAYLQTQGFAITNARKRTVNGLDFLVLVAGHHDANVNISESVWLIVAHGKIYQVTLTASDLRKAPELGSIMPTFAFAN